MSTLAIILGAATFEKYPDFSNSDQGSAFEKSAEEVASLLKSGLGLDQDSQVLNLFDSEDTAERQFSRVRQFLKSMSAGADDGNQDKSQNPKKLVIYYVGHGVFTSSQTYFLALRNTDEENTDYTGLSVDVLVNVLRDNFDGLTYMILDCCFAGAVVDSFQGDDGSIARVVNTDLSRQVVKSTGVAVLCASSKKVAASSSGKRGLTQFSECLAEVLQEGVNGLGELLSFRDVGAATRNLVQSKFGGLTAEPEVHSPVQGKGGQDPSDIHLFKNACWKPDLAELDTKLAESLISENHYTRQGAINAIQSILSNTRKPEYLREAARAALDARLDRDKGENDFQLRETILSILQPHAVSDQSPDVVDRELVDSKSKTTSRIFVWLFRALLLASSLIALYFYYFGFEQPTDQMIMSGAVAFVLFGVALFSRGTTRAPSTAFVPVSRVFALVILSVLIVGNATVLDQTELKAISLLTVLVLAYEFFMIWLQVVPRIQSLIGNCFMVVAMAFCLAATADNFNENEHLTIMQGMVGLVIWSIFGTRSRRFKVGNVTMTIDGVKASSLKSLFSARYGAAAPIQSNLAVNRIINRTFLSVEASYGSEPVGFANLVWSGDGPAEIDYVVTHDRVDRVALDMITVIEQEAKSAGVNEIQISNKALHDKGLRELLNQESESVGYSKNLCYTKFLKES